MKTVATSFILILFCLVASAQTSSLKKFNTLEFFFIDNGQAHNRIGLHDYTKLVGDMNAKIQDIVNKENYKFVMFQPNSFNPVIVTNFKERENYLNKVNEINEYEGPKFFLDDDAILTFFNKAAFNVTDKVNLYIYLQGDFVTNSLLKSNGELSLFLRYLPQQIYALSNCPEKSLNVYVEITNPKSSHQSAASIEDKVSKLANFYNDPSKPNYIKFTIKAYDEEE